MTITYDDYMTTAADVAANYTGTDALANGAAAAGLTGALATDGSATWANFDKVKAGATVVDVAGNAVSTAADTVIFTNASAANVLANNVVMGSATAPKSTSSSVLADATTAGKIEDNDTITLFFDSLMDDTTIGTNFNISVSNANPSVITVTKAVGGAVVATITTTGQQYNTTATTAMTFNTPSTGVWNASKKSIVITLAGLAGGTANTGVTANTPSVVLGAGAVSLAGGAGDTTTAVTGASGRF